MKQGVFNRSVVPWQRFQIRQVEKRRRETKLFWMGDRRDKGSFSNMLDKKEVIS